MFQSTATSLIVSMSGAQQADSSESVAATENASKVQQKKESQDPPKSYCATVCMVPPPSEVAAWEALTRARHELRDPGLYRWPPHANLLYPFLSLKRMAKSTAVFEGTAVEGVEKKVAGADIANDEMFDRKMLESLQKAADQCDPFNVTLEALGTFGGKSRGVLWIYPKSYPCSTQTEAQNTAQEGAENEEPLIKLQSTLEQHFPSCKDQRKQGKFSPHITLSHFASLEDAVKAQSTVETWWKPRTFRVSEIYVLRRVGDDGQFQIAATVPLGAMAGEVLVHDPPVPFTAMPKVEEDWVREERMKLKARRNGKWRSRRSGGGGRRDGSGKTDRGPSRSTDTPEEIAAKRAARKAKRERLERENAELGEK